ncbi:hypothetical protein GCM10010361_37930 [Streptomyces olivaceiscleroticus]|uniref:SMODS and SLOG-associating 2TM effector domain-containing protein n=1 Tax=Streptomyces olivaceiscleroticus TaxID=68245 RepID=A0ABN1A8E1_9ACTN
MIQLLLEEYRGLRNEITQRLAERTQITAVVGVAAVIVTAGEGFSFGGPHFYVAVAILTLGALWARRGFREMWGIAVHLRHLEERINALAAKAHGSSAVLTWEQQVHTERRREARSRPWLRPWLSGFHS